MIHSTVLSASSYFLHEIQLLAIEIDELQKMLHLHLSRPRSTLVLVDVSFCKAFYFFLVSASQRAACFAPRYSCNVVGQPAQGRPPFTTNT